MVTCIVGILAIFFKILNHYDTVFRKTYWAFLGVGMVQSHHDIVKLFLIYVNDLKYF
jgi:hypothetical protein